MSFQNTSNDFDNQKLINYKNDLMKHINKVLESIDELTNIKKITQNNSQDNQDINQTLESIIQTAFQGSKELKNDFDILQKQFEWKEFNIAFFGETNAGKSTLIEALTKSNGNTIGDGHKDFTKEISIRSFENINLLDMPGIEGNESLFIDEIKKAVNKAHIVIYVFSESKPPEEGTLKKIKEYLSNQVKVISVINIPGKAGIYKLKEKVLFNENIKKIENYTIKKFKEILSENYYTNVVLNAHIGFLSVGNPVREDLKKDQEKAKEVFGNLKNAYEFSNIKELEENLLKLINSSIYDIAISNTYKLFHRIDEVLEQLYKSKNEYDIITNSVIAQSMSTYEEAQRLINKYNDEMHADINSKLDELKNQLIKTIYQGIDDELSENEFKKQIDEIVNNFSAQLNELNKNKVNELSEELDKLFEMLNKRITLHSTLINLDSLLSIKDILEKLKSELNNVLNNISNIVLSVVTIIGLYIINKKMLRIISEIFSLIQSFLDWLTENSQRKKDEAKKKALDEIENKIKDVKEQLITKLDDVFKNFNLKLNNIYESINIKSLKLSLKLTSELVDKVINNIEETKKNISIDLIKFITGEKLEFAYIDLNIKYMFMIGNIRNINPRLLRIKEILRFNLDDINQYFHIKEEDNQLVLYTTMANVPVTLPLYFKLKVIQKIKYIEAKDEFDKFIYKVLSIINPEKFNVGKLVMERS